MLFAAAMLDGQFWILEMAFTVWSDLEKAMVSALIGWDNGADGCRNTPFHLVLPFAVVLAATVGVCLIALEMYSC